MPYTYPNTLKSMVQQEDSLNYLFTLIWLKTNSRKMLDTGCYSKESWDGIVCVLHVIVENKVTFEDRMWRLG